MMKRSLGGIGLVLCLWASPAAGQPQPPPRPPQTDEAATASRLKAIQNDPARLLAFLREMPKGGDLHMHLTGAIYAESYIRLSVDEGDCWSVASLAIVAPPCDAGAGRPPLGEAVRDANVYGQVVDALSMRNAGINTNGHDRFFATFGRFGPASRRLGELLDEVTARAADEHVAYLEVMLTPDGGASSQLGKATGWNPDLATLRQQLIAAGLREKVVSASRQALDAAEAQRNSIGGCSTEHPAPGCGVVVRYVGQVGRTGPPDQVFAQMLGWMELALADSRVVSLNLVQPEDAPTAVAGFAQQMAMLDFLHGLYPAVPITLHAGELAEGLVPPELLRSHIRDSIVVGHARRIGHGVDVMSENQPYDLLADMAKRRVAVEIALTSNDAILGVRGARHPLRTYLRYGVPVVIATDDLGVARSTHTHEFMKAVEEQGLDYLTLKRLVRNSIAYSFADAPTRARVTRDLEQAFRQFERTQAHQP